MSAKSTLEIQPEIDLEQEQTPTRREQAESTERRLGPEKLGNEWFANALSTTPSISATSALSCEMTSEFRLKQDPGLFSCLGIQSFGATA
jgi:hypothetical protein